jgi:hypothetical protein
MTDAMTEHTVDWRARFLASGDDADLPIVDAHQHYFDIERHYYPWLNDRPLRPFRYGDYSKICCNFLPEDYRRQRGRHRIVQTVVIEGEWDPATPGDEVRFIEALARKEPTLAAMVGQAWLDRADACELLREYGANPLVRGIRHKPVVTEREHWREALLRPAPCVIRAGAMATGCSPPTVCTSSCKRRGGTCRKPPNWRGIFRRSPSCSTTRACPPTALPKVWQVGVRRWQHWLANPT